MWHEFAFENYLDFITEKIAITRFRLSSHELQIERGIYENVLMYHVMNDFVNVVVCHK